MYTQLEEMRLVSDLLCVLGVSINSTDKILIDQDTNMPILFEGLNIKAMKDASSPAYISERDIKLEPANPRCTKLMCRLFGFFLDRELEIGNIKPVLTFFFEDVDMGPEKEGFSKLVVKYEDGSTYESKPYRSKALLYTCGILDIDESFPTDDLYKFDVDDDVIKRNPR